MDKKVLLIVGITTILVFSLAGCFGGEEKEPEIEYEPVNDTIDPESAWAESDWPDSNDPTVDTTLALSVNSTQKVVEITVTIAFEDSDAAHQESDDGSDPDDVTITVTNGDNTSQAATGSTPCTLTVKMNAPVTKVLIWRATGRSISGPPATGANPTPSYHVQARHLCSTRTRVFNTA